MTNESNRILTILTLAMLALAITGTAAGNGNETLFILGTDVNEAALKNASSNTTITTEINITIFTKNDTVPESLNFSNYSAIFIESQNETMVGMWDANITAAKENGNVVIGYNLSSANATVPNVDLKSAGYTDIERYWIEGGEENMEHFLMTIGKNFCDRWAGVDLPEPVMMHPKVNITYIMNLNSNLYYIEKVTAERSVISDRFNVKAMTSASAVSSLTDVSDQDVIMMVHIGANDLDALKCIIDAAKANGTHVGCVMFQDNDFGTIDMENPPYSKMKEYNSDGGYTNMENWIRCIGATLEDVYIEYAPPVPPDVPDHGICHPDAFPRIFENSTEYLLWYANKTDYQYNASAPTIGIIATYKLAKNPVYYAVDNAIIRELESEGCNVIYATYKVCSEDVDYFTRNRTVLVDAIISLKGFNLNYGDQEKGVEYLKKYNVPVLKAVIDTYTTPAEFENSSRGVSPKSIAYQVSMPEIDGCIDYIWIGGEVTDPDDPKLVYNLPITSQVEWLCDRAIGWENLGRTENKDKKIAILYYNHEGGKNNIGASYLDISPSFTLLLEEMREKDYNIGSGEIPNGSEFIDLFIESRNVGSWAPGALEEVVNSGNVTLVPVGEYLLWYNTLPESVRADVETRWGEPPGDIMVYDGKFVIPTVTFGNVIFVPQPTRGGLSDESAIYHDKTLPPTHQYLAAYFWINRIFDADAMIHFGTHGTQEWLPGNEVGLWRYDYPAIMVDDTPVVYP